MKQFYTFLAAVLLTATTLAQVGINTDSPHEFAALDIVSTTGGLLVPRMTNVERQAISNPAAGLQVFVTDFDGGRFMFYDGTEWGTLSFTEKRPDAPTTVTATGGDAQATVSFTAPSSNGGLEITSYTATSSPGDITAAVNQAGSGDITVTGLTNETAYTFTVTATNAIGTSVASAASNSVTPAPIAIGYPHQGGIVFYLDGNGGGLIAAPSDQSCCSNWDTAVSLCSNLTLGGYSDWFLPSKDELNLMWTNLADSDSTGSNSGVTDSGNLGNFSDDVYWSSSEYDQSSHAWRQYFSSGYQGFSNKYGTYYVRAVRAF